MRCVVADYCSFWCSAIVWNFFVCLERRKESSVPSSRKEPESARGRLHVARLREFRGNYGSFSLFLLVLQLFCSGGRVENLIVLRSSVWEIVKKSQRKIDFLLLLCVFAPQKE